MLTVDHLNEVLKVVWDLRSRWDFIGLALNISVGTLEAIKLKHHYDPDRCLVDMLTYWLRQAKPRPTWDALREALKSPQIALPPMK